MNVTDNIVVKERMIEKTITSIYGVKIVSNIDSDLRNQCLPLGTLFGVLFTTIIFIFRSDLRKTMRTVIN